MSFSNRHFTTKDNRRFPVLDPAVLKERRRRGLFFLKRVGEDTRTLTNLRMRLEQIGFVLKRIVPQREQGVFQNKYIAL